MPYDIPALENLVIGGTYTWTVTMYKDGALWDITGATVTHYFRAPDKTIKSYSMTLSDPTNGVAYHINPTATFDQTGCWEHSYKISLSGTILETEPEKINVYKSLSALA